MNISEAITPFIKHCHAERHVADSTLAKYQLDLLASSVSSWNTMANRSRTCIQWKFTRKARNKFGYTRNTSKRSET